MLTNYFIYDYLDPQIVKELLKSKDMELPVIDMYFFLLRIKELLISKEAFLELKEYHDSHPLPSGWERRKHHDGRDYYINHTKKTTTWIHPMN